MKTFEAFKIKNITLKNRLVMAPMCMYQAGSDGVVTEFHKVHYATRAYGGVGLVIIEATAVEPRGRISEHDLGIWDDSHIKGLKELVDIVHSAGAKIAIQLAHAGRKCSVRSETIIAPSSIAFSEAYHTPLAMDDKTISDVIFAFGQAAKRAKLAGFDVIEIHGAHGYLINQFISPLTNKREDGYGGSMPMRLGFLHDIIKVVRKEWEGPLFLRLSADEYAEGGHHIEDTIAWVKELGDSVDVINVSSGGVVPVSFTAFSKYQIPLAVKLKETGYAILGGGLITKLSVVEEVLTKDGLDLVYLGRELLRNPYFMLDAAKHTNQHDLIFPSYKKSFE